MPFLQSVILIHACIDDAFPIQAFPPILCADDVCLLVRESQHLKLVIHACCHTKPTIQHIPFCICTPDNPASAISHFCYSVVVNEHYCMPLQGCAIHNCTYLKPHSVPSIDAIICSAECCFKGITSLVRL